MGTAQSPKLSPRPRMAATPLNAHDSCHVKAGGRANLKKMLRRGAVLLGLALAQLPAVELGQRLAHTPAGADALGPMVAQVHALVGTPSSGPASRGAITALARGHHVQLLARADAALATGDPAIAEAHYTRLFVHSHDWQVRSRARDGLVAIASKQWPSGFRAHFLASLSPAVLTAARAHRVPPSVTLAQAILESGWGRSGLTRDYHNLFGVKAGRSSQRVRMASHEHSRGRLRPSRQTFRRYSSKAQSIWDHAELLGSDRRYAHARGKWTDWRAFLEAIAPRYASSPTYVAAVSQIVELYELDRWDALIVQAVAADERAVEATVTADLGPARASEDEAGDTGVAGHTEG